MTASTIKSENVTNIEATPSVTLDRRDGVLQTMFDIDNIAITSEDEAGDLWLFGPINSTDKIIDVLFLNDDLDSHACPLLATNVGLYYSGIGGDQFNLGKVSGDVIDADCFAAASTIFQAAKLKYESVRFTTDDIIDVNKEAWEVGGLSTDPGGLFYIGVAVSTAAATDAAGDVVCRVDYISK